jgi:hypothetical protein
MSRPLRHVPRPGCLFEVIVRTVQARFLLRPSVALNEIVLGVLARAQRGLPQAQSIRSCERRGSSNDWARRLPSGSLLGAGKPYNAGDGLSERIQQEPAVCAADLEANSPPGRLVALKLYLFDGITEILLA